MLTSACVSGSAVTQPASPLPPNITSRLTGNHWQVVEITLQGESIQFDTLQPLYFWFEQAGTLNFSSPHCAGGAYLVFFESERRYRLGRGEVAAEACGEPGNTEFDRVTDALAATTEYEIRDSQLFLTGEDVRIVLEIDNPH